MAAKAAQGRARRREACRTRRSSRSYAGYVYGDSHLRPARRLRGRAHRHSGHQREQQLLHRLDRAVPGARRPSRAGWPSACSRSASRRWRRARSASSSTTAPTRSSRHVNVMNKVQGFNSAPAGGADVRRRRPRVPLEVRHQARDLRQDLREGAQARQQEPVRAVQPECSSSRRSWPRAEVFDPLTRFQCCPPTCGAAAAVLCSRRVRQEARHLQARVHRRAGDDDRLRRRSFEEDSMIKMVRLRHGQGGGEEGRTRRRASARRTCDVVELHDCFTANELLTYEALGLCPEGERREVHLGRRQHLRRQVGHQPVGRPAVEGPPARRHRPRAVHRAGVAAARPGRAAPGAGRQGRAAAQPGPRRRVRA